jgi:DNA repair protein RadC
MSKKKKTKYITRNRLMLSMEETVVEYKKVRQSYDIYEFLKEVWDMHNIDLFEEFCVLYLSRANKIIGYSFISSGGFSGTVADGKMIFTSALMNSNASSLAIAHNHPSGMTKASEADKRLTTSLCKFGRMIDLPIVDHLIITSSNGYFSFADEGLIE